MKYQHVTAAAFIDRPNRFIAHADVNGYVETVHVKNAGRCRELLLPGAEVWLSKSDNPARKTAYDLIAVRKTNGLLVNIDSQAPNAVAREWLDTQGFDEIRPEFRYGLSRLDFMMRRGEDRFLMEVKGCTLERGGIGYFPDAPTERGARHLKELAGAAGYHPILLFVIQMDGVAEVRGNRDTDPAFCTALDEAEKAGVEVRFLSCHIEPDAIKFMECRRKKDCP
jgi:sugar fermentation stimulation protein A